jgi:hypothetical protein
MMQSKTIEQDLRQKFEVVQRKNEQLQIELFKSSDAERKVVIEL